MSLLRDICIFGEGDQVSKSERRHHLYHARHKLTEPSKPELEFESFVHRPEKWVLVASTETSLKSGIELG